MVKLTESKQKKTMNYDWKIKINVRPTNVK